MVKFHSKAAILFLIFYFIKIEAHQQNDYNLTNEWMKIVEYNTSVLLLKADNFKYNRTHTAMNITANLMVDLNNDLEFIIESFKFASNEYRAFPMNFRANVCEGLKKNDFGFQNIYSCGNFTRCPMLKGNYIICNWAPDQDKFPPFIPSGRYMVQTKWMFKSRQIVLTQWYMKVEKRFRFV